MRVPTGAISGGSVAYNDRYAWEGGDYAPLRQRSALRVYARDGDMEYWAADVHLERPRFRYRFGLETAEGLRWFGWDGLTATPGPTNAFEYAYLAEGDRPDSPEWARGATFYQIFPDRFARSAGAPRRAGLRRWDRPSTRTSVFGGDLDGIVEHLDHIASLSVDALYLTPVFAAPSNHKYDTSDYFSVDPGFGGNLALRRLVAALHARGMRLILDGVFNHVGATWPPFQDVLRNGPASPFAPWFHLEPGAGLQRGPDQRLGYETWATDVASLPKLRTSEPELRDLICRVGRFWVQEFGVDGWRLDVADEVDHRLWKAFRAAVRAASPETFLVGEVWYPALPWLRGDELDSVMDYPMRRAVLDFLATGKLDGPGFLDRVDRGRAAYPESRHTFLYNLLGSHDSERVLTACGGDRARVAAASALGFMLPGIVSTYYGDEVGMEGRNDPGSRGGMVWDDRQDLRLLDLHRRLGRLRRRSRALRAGSYRRLFEDGRVIGFGRETEEERVAVVVNAGTAPAAVPAAPFRDWLGGPARIHETFGYETGTASSSRGTLRAPPMSVTVLRRNAAPAAERSDSETRS